MTDTLTSLKRRCRRWLGRVALWVAVALGIVVGLLAVALAGVPFASSTASSALLGLALCLIVAACIAGFAPAVGAILFLSIGIVVVGVGVVESISVVIDWGITIAVLPGCLCVVAWLALRNADSA
jgi:hypothetical protein